MSHDNLQEDKDNKNHVMTGEFVLFYMFKLKMILLFTLYRKVIRSFCFAST